MGTGRMPKRISDLAKGAAGVISGALLYFFALVLFIPGLLFILVLTCIAEMINKENK